MNRKSHKQHEILFVKGKNMPKLRVGMPSSGISGACPCKPGRGTRLFLWFSLVVFLLSPFSCKKEKSEEVDTSNYEIAKQYKRGLATLDVKVDRKEITIADQVNLVLQVNITEDFEVEMPKFGEKLEQFLIKDYRIPPPRLIEDGKLLLQRTYVLEPFLSGEYTIPAMKIQFWKKDEADGPKYELETEALAIQVKSLLPETTAELEIRDIAAPVSLPPPSRVRIYAIAGGGIALLLFAVLFMLWWKRRRVDAFVIPKIPAHELAYRELEKLLAEKLLDQEQVKGFYYKLTDILRHYIENRFGLHAPERTSEEFLDELQISNILQAEHKQLLKDYMQHCDLVKFAEHQPATEDIQKTFDACKRFIVETESAEALVPETRAA